MARGRERLTSCSRRILRRAASGARAAARRREQAPDVGVDVRFRSSGYFVAQRHHTAETDTDAASGRARLRQRLLARDLKKGARSLA
jgi:hypothetical protein